MDDDEIDLDLLEARANAHAAPPSAPAEMPVLRLDPDAWEALKDATRRGMPLVRACHIAGLNPKLVRRMLSQHKDLAAELQQMLAARSAEVLDVIYEAATRGFSTSPDKDPIPDWRAAKAYLDLTDPRLGRPKESTKAVVKQQNTLVITHEDAKQLGGMDVSALRRLADDA